MLSFAAPQASFAPMQILRRLGLILFWLAGFVSVFAAGNKNDPYLISLRGTGNIVLAAARMFRLSCASEMFCKPTWHRHGALGDTSSLDTRHSPKWPLWLRRV